MESIELWNDIVGCDFVCRPQKNNYLDSFIWIFIFFGWTAPEDEFIEFVAFIGIFEFSQLAETMSA